MWDIIWVSPQGHRSVSVSRHFLLQALQCPCSVRKRFSRDHCCRERSNPGCQIVGSHTGWQLTTRADFQLCLHRLLMSTGCKFSQLHWLPVTDRINYKLCLFVYKALHGFMPDYLSELCIPAFSVDYRYIWDLHTKVTLLCHGSDLRSADLCLRCTIHLELATSRSERIQLVACSLTVF